MHIKFKPSLTVRLPTREPSNSDMKIKNLPVVLSLSGALLISACWSSETKNRNDRPLPSSTVSETNKSPSNNSKTPDSVSNKMSENTIDPPKSGGYSANLPGGFNQPTDAVGQRILKDYGALFVARGGAVPPNTVIFKNEAEVSAYQASLSKSSESIGGFNIELQAAAMKALKEAIAENVTITPNGADSAKRDYAGTVTNWASRVNPGLTHWVGKGRMTEAEAAKIRQMSPFEQVPEIFRLESQGIFFSKDLSKSIVYSVAPPGTSQHLSMLALDVKEHGDARVRAVLAKHGWFQTVVSDLPHFTYLGVPENQLTGLGLKKVTDGGRDFWVPSL